MFTDKSFKAYFAPPLFLREGGEDPVSQEIKDMSSANLVTREKAAIAFQMDPKAMSNLSKFDPTTKLISKTDWTDFKIKKMVIGAGNQPIAFDMKTMKPIIK